MIISTDISDCFSETDIILEDGKEYMVYIASCFASSYPIVQLYSKYNPIFICDICEEDVIDVPKQNFLTLNSKCRARIQNGDTTFSKVVSESELVAKLLTALRKRQENVWVKTFVNDLEFQPLFNDNVKSLGLSPEQSYKWNNKIEQYRQFEDVVPIADFITTSRDEAVNCFDELASSIGVVTSLPRNSQGAGVRLHADKAGLQEYLSQVTEDTFLLMTALSVKSAQSIDLLIANKDEIIVYGLSEQILDGVVCLGAKSPTNLSQETMAHCYEIANNVGAKLAEDGLRGIVGIDFIIDEDDRVYFCELNARYSGTTHIRMLSFEQEMPQSKHSIVDLEIMALNEGTLNWHQSHSELEDIFWYKKEIFSNVSGKVRGLNIANNALKLAQLGKGAVIVGQRKEGVFVTKNKTLGNLICLGRTKEELNESIRTANGLVDQYVPVGL